MHNEPVALLAVLSNHRLLSDRRGGLRLGRGPSGLCKVKEENHEDRRSQESDNESRDWQSVRSVVLLGQGNTSSLGRFLFESIKMADAWMRPCVRMAEEGNSSP